MKKLHPTQANLLKLLKKHIDNPLTIRDLGELLGEDSTGVVYHHLQQLEKKGYIKRNPENPRDYTILDSPEKAVVYLNKYGMAQCGPSGSILDGSPIEKIPMPAGLLRYPAHEMFIVEARGDSMEDEIYEGDIVIAKKQNFAEHNDLVVCVHNSEALIKKYSSLDGMITLHSINSKKYNPINANESLRIEGIVKNILHYN